jgi:hypothetical protein
MHITEATLNDAKATAQVHHTQDEMETICIFERDRDMSIYVCTFTYIRDVSIAVQWAKGGVSTAPHEGL